MGINQLLLWGGVVAGPLFIIVFLIEGALRNGYRPLCQPVSSLSKGDRGQVQQANFFSSGVLLLACAFGLPAALQQYGGSFWGPLLIGTYALGLLGAGLFVTDSQAGEGIPQSVPLTTSGKLHDLFSAFVFISLFAACFVFAHLFAGAGQNAWAVYSIVTGILYGCGFILFARGFSPASSFSPIAGLLQRLTISIGAIWLALVSLHLLGLF